MNLVSSFKKKNKTSVVYLDENNEKGSCFALILPRDLYFECEKEFPFKSLNEIKQAIRSDLLNYSPFETDLFFIYRTKFINNKSRVTIWFIKKKGINKIYTKSPFFIIPESAVFLKDKKNFSYKIIKDNFKNLYISYSEKDGLKSLETNGLNDSKNIAHFLNCTNIKTMCFDVYKESLMQKFNKFGFSEALAFFYLSKSFVKKIRYELKKTFVFFLIILGCFSFYTISSTWYIGDQLKIEKENISEEVKFILENKRKLGKRIDDYTSLRDVVSSKYLVSSFFIDLSKLLPEKTFIKKIDISGGYVKLNVLSENSAEFVRVLKENKKLKKVNISSTISQDKKSGKEQFEVSCVLLR